MFRAFTGKQVLIHWSKQAAKPFLPNADRCASLHCNVSCERRVLQNSRKNIHFNRYSHDRIKLLNSVLADQPHRNAGHSKWQNIKHVKQANDLARSKEIGKLISLMKVAVREGGSTDPKVNAKLAQVIAQAKQSKVPMAAIDRNLQSLQAKKDLKNSILPVKGPGNSIMLLDIEADNITRVKQELSPILRKNRGILADDSVLFMFEHKGILFCSELNGKPVSKELLDAATEHAIESGANDVEFINDHPEYGTVLEFVTEPSAFFKVKNALEELKYEIEFAEVAYIPSKWVELEDEDSEAANKLYTKLSDHTAVQKIFVNIA